VSTPGIRVDGVWKKFRRGPLHDSLRDLIPAAIATLSGRRGDDALKKQEFWALQDVSFHVEPGEALGVIGHNGAGKSTLLKIVNQIIRPSRGYTEIRGRTGSLIEISAGFHPDLTGRQNVFLQGSIIGMTNAEIARKFDQIVEFAGIADFIDTPVKRYSSGMNARLGFSIAAHLDTEVLIIDEVLAVGDLAFQDRAFGRVREMVRSGIPVILVTHQIERMTSLCTRAMLLEGGKVAAMGTPEECVEAYVNAVSQQPHHEEHVPMRLERLELLTAAPVASGDRVNLRLTGNADSGADAFDVQVRVRSTSSGNIIFSTLAGNCGIKLPSRGAFALEVELQLNVGRGILMLETAIIDRARRVEAAAGPRTHLQVTDVTTFNGSVQMNPVMTLKIERPQDAHPVAMNDGSTNFVTT
jgi:ABC-type polysaccharide/polyol phosphate transport system ATPase subunit